MAVLLLGCHLHAKCKAREELFPFTFPYADSRAIQEVTHKSPALPQQKVWMTCADFHPILPLQLSASAWLPGSLLTYASEKPLHMFNPVRHSTMAGKPSLCFSKCPAETWMHFAYHCTHSNSNKCLFPRTKLIVFKIKWKIIKFIC